MRPSDVFETDLAAGTLHMRRHRLLPIPRDFDHGSSKSVRIIAHGWLCLHAVSRFFVPRPPGRGQLLLHLRAAESKPMAKPRSEIRFPDGLHHRRWPQLGRLQLVER
jgi:hypothetical protein